MRAFRATSAAFALLAACHSYKGDVESICDPAALGGNEVRVAQSKGIDFAQRETLYAQAIMEHLHTDRGRALFKEEVTPGADSKAALAHWRSEAAAVGVGRCVHADDIERSWAQYPYEVLCSAGGFEAYRAHNPNSKLRLFLRLEKESPERRQALLEAEATAVGLDCKAAREDAKAKGYP